MNAAIDAPSMTIRDRLKDPVKSLFNRHRADGSPNVFVFTMPRSGSTWLMELIAGQPGFKTCSEPLNIRLPLVREHLGVTSWHELHDPALRPRLERYFQAFCDGRLHFLDPLPWRSSAYRFHTRRIVFKVIHGGEERINWFRDTFNGRIVYLLRHPIAVSLSHEVLPRLDAYVRSEYRNHFDAEQLRFAEDILASGTELERGVLAWCFENAVPLRQRTSDWAVVTYEQLVLDPRSVIDSLVQRLALVDPDRMLASVTKASAVTRKSDPATRRLLEQQDRASRRKLVDKWRDRVSPEAERHAMRILDRFGIDAYTVGEALPASSLWIGSRG